MQGTRWCVKCADSVELIQAPVCPVCGRSQECDELCVRCQTRPLTWNKLRSVAKYGGALRHAIHGLKYRRDLGLGEVLSRLMIQLFQSLSWDVDLLVPVPLDLARMRERGYNQVSLLAVPLALSCGLPYRPGALRKVKPTPRQVTLSAELRRTNLEGAFVAEQQQVSGKTVLLIDDVITTGATLEACCLALREAGANQVLGLNSARAGSAADHTERIEDSWANQ